MYHFFKEKIFNLYSCNVIFNPYVWFTRKTLTRYMYNYLHGKKILNVCIYKNMFLLNHVSFF